ncbi:ParB/RepB/Spo0J family partition protein [Bacillus sp. MMSF_3328]|uniref:ParB/RepB/Spo0J family partition protein n=1 Tax=Bacillus sp. MMSF_3328 TaxID=3047080 RepID=UPI00273CF64F|nr:ParB/RepB/Spo0J family partition protein [Bacillus sp. MMSF_3328]
MVEQQAQESHSINRINQALPGSFKLAVIPVEELEFLEKNARFMRNETFQNLVNNIKRDGAISQLPFCYLQENGKYKVLSGNHRSKAAIAAGLTEIPVLYTDEPLTKDEQISIQLSHNSISGEDDPFILAELYNEIQDLDMKYYAGLDDKQLEQLDKVTVEGLTEAQLDYLMLTFLFLPDEAEEMVRVFEKARDFLTSDSVAVSMREYDRLLDAQAKVQTAYNIHNGATSLMLIMDIFERHQEDLKNGWLDENGEAAHKGWAPLSSIFGTDNVPAESAAVINRAVEKMMNEGDIDVKNKWQLIEYLAADYLNT